MIRTLALVSWAAAAPVSSTTFHAAGQSITIEVSENPNAVKNIFGRLKRSTEAARLININGDFNLEEEAENVKIIYDGQGGMSQKVLASGRLPPSAGFYDRLTAENLSGYSPEVLAIQNSLNLHRAPGAPRLAETGRIDAETLIYPAYGMRHDLANLAARRHGLRLDRLRSAIDRFEATARSAGSPGGVSVELLKTLGAQQRQAARLIAAAALEDDLALLEQRKNFMNPELAAIIDQAPFSLSAREAYKQQGAELKMRLERLKADHVTLIKTLSDTGKPLPPAIDKTLRRNVQARKTLELSIQDFARIPYALRAEAAPRPWWRRLFARLSGYLFPAGRMAREENQRRLLERAFVGIAEGDFQEAREALKAP